MSKDKQETVVLTLYLCDFSQFHSSLLQNIYKTFKNVYKN